MAVIKCKMCGGDLALIDGQSVAECEYCGSRQTVPNTDNEKKLTLFSRANRLRIACEFDKAAGIYESIVSEFPEEAESYWGLVLCKYGIEYVDDPATGKKIPTCHRSSFDSVMDDPNFEQALENADAVARRVYREEAKQIEELRKGIIAVSSHEEPYDIFICYKETGEDGERTLDSVLAQDIYDALTDKGYRVFFSRITLEDKLGQEYEPYIFAALNSAKIMLAIGTDYEYFNAVWVKNEWSRFLKLMASDKTKHLIPCFKGIDAYDMPKEFAKLQGQDLGKMGAIQDILRGVEKLLPKPKKSVTVIQQTVVQNGEGQSTAPLLERGYLFLEDRKWDSADTYFERVLDLDPKNAQAYLGKLLAELHLTKAEFLGGLKVPFDGSDNYKKVIRFADDALRASLNGHLAKVKQRYAKDMAEKKKREEEEKRKEIEAYRLAREENRQRLAEIRKKYVPAQELIGAGFWHSVVLKTDGTVVAAGKNSDGQCDVSDWREIIAIAVGSFHTVGLKADGTVVAVGKNEDGRCNVKNWTDIIAISASGSHTVGLKADGTVVATGLNKYGQCDVSEWKDIIAIAAGDTHTVGLKKDGKMVAVGSNEEKQCDVSIWTDVVAVRACSDYTVCLQADGTVVTMGNNRSNRCSVSMWKDIVAISACSNYTVGIKSNGKAEEAGKSSQYSSKLFWQRSVAAVAEGFSHMVILKTDGTLEIIGDKRHGKGDVSNVRLFNNLNTLEQERTEARAKLAEEERIAKQKAERRAAGRCQHCGGELKGFFSKKCVSCGKPKDY